MDAKRYKVDTGKRRKNDESHRNESMASYSGCRSGRSSFYFESWKKELNVLLSYHGIVDKVDDFWKFVKLYLDRKAKELKHETAEETLCIPLKLDRNPAELHKRFVSSRDLSLDKFIEFCGILRSYLYFAHSKIFEQLCHLRAMQRNLPIATYRQQIVEAVKDNSVVIIAGDTGCGKSTQVPQYLLAAGFQRIVCTQPRRIACTSLCKRVAFETLDQVGQDIGYQIRFEKTRKKHTKIVFMTEGLLLRQVCCDPLLKSFDVVVIDEAHERNLQCDFLVGILKCLIHKRPDLKLVLMSATINLALFESFFAAELPVLIQVPGRMYDVGVHYRPVSREDMPAVPNSFTAAPYIRILEFIDEEYPRDERGDVLIFLPGLREITSVVDAANDYNSHVRCWIVLPLHSTLSLADQNKVFDYAPDGMRKCIAATNIAETSVTIDGIRFVVDSGKMKQMMHDRTSHMSSLKECWVSQASAEQRKGRAGRTGPGVCYRIYEQNDYAKFLEFTEAEVRRVPLEGVLLQLMSMGLSDVRRFPFVEAPPEEALETALLSLKQHGALDEEELLTEEGRLLAAMPVEVGIGKLLLAGVLLKHEGPALALAAALSVQSPFVSKVDKNPEVQEARSDFDSDHGDPFILLSVVKEWLQKKREGASAKTLRSWCRKYGLEEQRFFEMAKLQHQFRQILQVAGVLEEQKNENMSASERALHQGERRLLYKKRKEYHSTGPSVRKRLQPNQRDVDGEDDLESCISEMHHIEFQLRHSKGMLETMVSGASAETTLQLNILKVLLLCGLYPNFALPESRVDTNETFFTPHKKKVCIHRTSYFIKNQKVLHVTEGENEDSPYRPTLGYPPWDSGHQMLCYGSLIDTGANIPYLINSLRVPAAAALLLFSKSLDTNYDFTSIICDDWTTLEFTSPRAAATLLQRACLLRAKWARLLELKLEAVSKRRQDQETEEPRSLDTRDANAAPSSQPDESQRLSATLTKELPRFLSAHVFYSVGQTYRSRSNHLPLCYAGPGANEQDIMCNPFFPNDSTMKDFKIGPHPVKGGMRLTPFLNYNNINKTSLGATEEWSCPLCGVVLSLPLDVLQHEMLCKPSVEGPSPPKQEPDLEPDSRTSGVKSHTCDKCGIRLQLTMMQMLRHINTCGNK